jgi:hypothetical protein
MARPDPRTGAALPSPHTCGIAFPRRVKRVTGMDTQLALRAPFEKDLSEKLKELARLQAELVDRELFLTNLCSEIHAFEVRYIREVGALYLKLDEWNVRIAKARSEELYIDSAKIQQELSELLGEEGVGQVSKTPGRREHGFGQKEGGQVLRLRTSRASRLSSFR